MGRESIGPEPHRRARLPWVIFAIAAAALAFTMVLSILNGPLEPFLFLAVLMVAGYTTVGAIVASRRPNNAMGWILMFIGISFLLSGLGEEYVRYTYVTDFGSLPFGTGMAWLTNWTWNVVTGAVLLMVALYPTGRMHARGWRFLPPLIVAISVAGVLGAMVRKGPLGVEAPVEIQNPLGIIEWTGPIARGAELGLVTLLIFAAVASVASLVHRYLRATAAERQQLRLFVYAISVATLLMAAAAISGPLLRNEVFSDVLFFSFFPVVGIGVPAAVGVAMLRYRLLEVDVVIRKTVVYGILAIFLTAVFLLGIGLLGLLAGTRNPATLAVLAFVVGALTIPLWRLSRRIADRVVFGGRASPYELLAGFGERMATAYSTDDVLPRVAEILGTATGAARAQVWLHVGRELRPAAVWPEGSDRDPALALSGDGLPRFPEGEDATAVRHQGELLGALSVRTPPSDPMTPAKEKLVHDLAQQAGLVLRNVRLIEELRGSRARLVAAQDEERRRLERNIHDGAQQQLVALAVNLKLARTLADRDPTKVADMLERLQHDTQQSLEDLRDLARGIYPPLLADKGLAAALEAQARKVSFPVDVQPNGVGRFPQEVEAAIYFCVLEALQNAAKYAEASRAVVSLRRESGEVVFEVSDDGRGFDPLLSKRGAGLQNMEDRVAALGGALEVRSRPGEGVRIVGRVPASGVEVTG